MMQEISGNLIPVMVIGCAFLVFVFWIFMETIDSIYKTRCTTRLKERLIERGHSPYEIDLFLKAGKTHDEWGEPIQPVPPVKSTASPLVDSFRS